MKKHRICIHCEAEVKARPIQHLATKHHEKLARSTGDYYDILGQNFRMVDDAAFNLEGPMRRRLEEAAVLIEAAAATWEATD